MKALRASPAARDANEPSKSASVAARLRALARQHGEGQLSRDAYRKLRAPLIDALDGPDALDSQSSTIPHFEPRVRTSPVPLESVSAAPGAPQKGSFGKILSWLTSPWRR